MKISVIMMMKPIEMIIILYLFVPRISIVAVDVVPHNVNPPLTGLIYIFEHVVIIRSTSVEYY